MYGTNAIPFYNNQPDILRYINQGAKLSHHKSKCIKIRKLL